MKEIEIIPIATKKSKRREIPEEWIIETINFPVQIVDGYGGRKVAHKKYLVEDKKYLLRVVYEEKEDLIEIINRLSNFSDRLLLEGVAR